MPTCIRAICSSTSGRARGGGFRHHGQAHDQGAALPRGNPLRVHHPRLHARVAQVHFDAGYVPDHQDRALFAQALRAIGEPLMDRSGRGYLHGRPPDAAVRGHRPVRHADPAAAAAAAKDHGGGGGGGAHAQPQAQHVGDCRAGGALMDRGRDSARKGGSRRRRRARCRSGAS